VAVAEAATASEAASNDTPSLPPSQIVMRDQLYRLAMTEQHVEQLQAAAHKLSEYCTWWTADELIQAGVITPSATEATVLGGLHLNNGCCLLHVPSYLQGLWAACRERGAVWELVGDDDDNADNDWKARLQDFDAVVLAAGSGLFSAPTPKHDSTTINTSNLLSSDDFPLQLVRGQSVELRVPDDDVKDDQDGPPSQALLCGKYVSPLPGDPNLFLVGATHEFREDTLSPTAVVEELQNITEPFSSHLWKNATVERWTIGYRVQSERNQYGRRPIIGRLPTSTANDTDIASSERLPMNPMIHPNTWIFTGLSSRGLLFHGLYGDILTDAILAGNEAPMLSRDKDLTWWRT
jgi:glycine/D-amino acid oxidase-like deaminating enzyme